LEKAQEEWKEILSTKNGNELKVNRIVEKADKIIQLLENEISKLKGESLNEK